MKSIRTLSLGLALGLMINLAGCAGSGTSTQNQGEPAATKPAALASVPAGSRLAQVRAGMSEEEVRSLFGEPTSRRSYPTAKNFIPFYFGGDTHRTDWIYPGVGRVIFGNTAAFSTRMHVVERKHNPEE